MKKENWLLLFFSAILYAIPFLFSDCFWWLIFIFPIPLLYITCTENLSFMHGYVWGVFVFALHVHAGILIVAHLAHEWWWLGFLMGVIMVLYQALVPGILFWCATQIATFFSIQSTIIRLLLWANALAIFIVWVDRYCMYFFDMNGYPFMHPLLLLAQYPLLLRLLPIIGKQLLLLFFLLVPVSIVIVLWYRNFISVLLCVGVLMSWGWCAMYQPKYESHPHWYKQIYSLPCMIRAHTARGAMHILGRHIRKCTAAYPEASIILMPESALEIVDDEMVSIANITLFNRSEFSPALALNLLKGFFERSRIPFNKFRASANKINISSCFKGMFYIWHRYCKKGQFHLIFGACSYEHGNYYNSLYWIRNGTIQARFDKKHTMLMTESLPHCMEVDWLRKIYFRDDIFITPSCMERKLLQVSEATAFVPYICSELFFNEYPDDCYGDVPIIAIVNDMLFINSYQQKLLMLLARFKAIYWQRDIVYVSYGISVCIDKQARTKVINE